MHIFVIFSSFCWTAGPPVTEADTTTEELTTPSGFVCPSDGRFPYPDNCTLYYVCTGGVALLIVTRELPTLLSYLIFYWIYY